MTEESQINVNINIKVELSEGQIKTLSQLISTFYPRVFPYGSKSLLEICVVEDELIEEEVNRLFAQCKLNTSYKKKDAHGVALPLSYLGQFFTVIILGSSQIPNNENECSFSNISTVLEELMHVQLYEEIQDIEDYYCNRDKNPIQAISHQIVNEYIVNRRKYSILAEIYGTLGYNQELIPLFHDVEDKLLNIVNNAAMSIKSIDESCTELLTIVYRDLFEPLTRYQAGFDVINGIPEIPLEKYDFLNNVAYAYWESIQEELRSCFNNPGIIIETMNDITQTLTNFLRKIGVTYRELDDGSYYFHFDNSYFVKREYMKRAIGSFPFGF